MVMDEADRKRFLDTLRSDDDFRSAVRRELLTDELLNLPQVVASLATDLQQLTGVVNVLVDGVAQQRQDSTVLAADVRNYMERTITLIGEGFTAIHGQISELRTDVDAGFTAVDAKFDQINAEISELRTDVDTGFTAVDAKFDQINAEIREIKDQLAS